MRVEYDIETGDEVLVVSELKICDQALEVLYFEKSVVVFVGEGTVENEYPFDLGKVGGDEFIGGKVNLRFCNEIGFIHFIVQTKIFAIIRSFQLNQPVLFALIAVLTSACSLTFNSSSLRLPRQFELLFSPSKNNNKTLCFYFDAPHSTKTYLLRLDYLPYQCLSADNDRALEWDGTSYFTEVTVSRKCKSLTLRQFQQMSYRFIYEFREGFNEGGVMVSNEMVYQYLPTIVVLFVVSVVVERVIGGEFRSKKGKSD